MMKIIKTVCDVCKKETSGDKFDIQVIFTTEQNEGNSCEHYLENKKLNLCDGCLNNILYNGNYVFAEGAMGHNKYSFYKLGDSNVKD